MILVTPHRYDANSGCIVGIRFSFKKGSQTFTIQLYMDLFGPFGWISPFPTIWYGTKDTTWLAEIHSTIPRNDRNRSPGHVVLLEQTISQRVRLKLVCLAFSFRVLDYSTQCLQTELLHQSKPSIVWAKIINPGQNQFNCTGAETQKKTFHCSETIIIAKTMKHNKREFQHIFFPCMYIYIYYIKIDCSVWLKQQQQTNFQHHVSNLLQANPDSRLLHIEWHLPQLLTFQG
jgi:hypothetical protein